MNLNRMIAGIGVAMMGAWMTSCSFSLQSADESNSRYIDPKIGNVGHLLQPTRPTVQLPNEMMRMYPMRADYMDDQISSFPLIIVSHRLGQAFSLKPGMGVINERSWKEKLTYDHDLELTRPWYYSTYLVDQGIKVEFVPGKKTGIYRFKFPKGGEHHLLFDRYNKKRAKWNFISDTELAGVEYYQDSIQVFMYGRFSKGAATGTSADELSRVWISFQTDDDVEFRYAISYISAEQARKNFSDELTGVTLDGLKEKGEATWQKVMGQIQVKGGSDAQKRSFYSALYRCYERMVDINEDGKYYSGFDGKIHESNRPFYVDDWTWDTYLAHHPLRAILNPEMEGNILNAYVQMYEQSGWMPTFPVLFGDHACMNGFHSSIMILDDYRKGIRNFDISKAYEGMRKNAQEATMLPWRNGVKMELDDFYHRHGYYPALPAGETERYPQVHPFEKRQAVAVTLGHSYDDWALAEMARELNKNCDYELFHPRSVNYKNLWNDQQKMFIPKDSSGNWLEIDPKFDGGTGGRDYYDENNGWTYAWQVQEDIDGLIGLYGGKKTMEDRLDQLFREGLGRSKTQFWSKFPDASGLVGQFSMGNEPSFHIPYLYDYTGAPWKTQKRIRFLLDTWFKDNVFGIPGDEDGGGMSAFVVFSMMGFYPVSPGKPLYSIGSPVFEDVSITLYNGRKFRVSAHHASPINKYIQHANLNGERLDEPWFSHEQLMNGGILELEMGPLPNKTWGIGK